MHTIEAAFDRAGQAPAVGFFDDLLRAKRTRPFAGDAAQRLEDFARAGRLEVPRELNRLHDELWEIKAQRVRLPLYYATADCADVRVTHGFLKNSQKTPRREIDRGLAIIREDKKR